MNAHRVARVVCVDVRDGTVTYRGGAGAGLVLGGHDDQGSWLLIEDRARRGYVLVRADDRPRAAVFLGEGQIESAGPFVWRVDPFGNVRRWDTRSLEPDPTELDRALGPEPPPPEPRGLQF